MRKTGSRIALILTLLVFTGTYLYAGNPELDKLIFPANECNEYYVFCSNF